MTDEKEKGKTAEPSLYAVVRLRGKSKANRQVTDTLERLNITRANQCTIDPADPTHNGMLMQVADFVTWGPVSPETLTEILEKRGFGREGKRIDSKHAKSIAKKALHDKKMDYASVNPVFRLSPPSAGLKSVKLRYPRGDMGPRGGKINELLARMI